MKLSNFFATTLIFSILFFSACEIQSTIDETSEAETTEQSASDESSDNTNETSTTSKKSSKTSKSQSDDSTGTTTDDDTESTDATDESDDSSTTSSSDTIWTYTATAPIYELANSLTSLTILGAAKGQNIYLTKINPTSSVISASYTQYVASATNVSLSTAESSTTSTETSSSGSFPEPGSHGGPGRHHFIPADLSEYPEPEYNYSRSAVSSQIEIEQITPLAGSTTKDIYVDSDSSLSTYTQKSATLRAVGQYCYIWLVDADYSEDEEVSDDTISLLAQKFDEIYPLVRNIFGNESDEIYYSYSSSDFTTAAMEKLSDTGTMVNIVIYDIGADHSNDDASGVLGYFYAKDYYPNNEHLLALSNMSYSSSDVRNYSNEGKYFYIDAYYAQSQTQMILSTLVHEFQHMIDWGVKSMEQDLSPSTGFNEMLSMLCEDIMQEYLGISDSDSPKGRLPMFEQCYTDCGLEYRSTSTYLQVLSYSSNYAFGSWIARQFGGAKVISEMSKNAYIDTEAIVAAVNSVNDTSYTIEDLLKMYSIACIIQADCSSLYDWPSFNISSEISASEVTSYTYPLSAIDLWNLQESLSDFYETVSASSNSSYYKFDGPELYGYNAQKALRPYGMTLINVGTVNEDDAEITLSFGNTSPSTNEKAFIIIN